jgi:hypothetical protein
MKLSNVKNLSAAHQTSSRMPTLVVVKVMKVDASSDEHVIAFLMLAISIEHEIMIPSSVT